MNLPVSVAPLDREQIAWRCAQDIRDGMYVNLGLGLPTLVGNYVPEGREVVYQSENGILGMGPVAEPHEADQSLPDAGGQRVTLLPGGALFDSAESFAMIRGGHLDLALLGAFEVSAAGDIANWDAGVAHRGPLIGGAMDLVHGAKDVWVLMTHVTAEGKPKLVRDCALKLTGRAVVTRIYTDLTVVEVGPKGFVAREIVPGLTLDALQAVTGAPIEAAPDLGVLAPPSLAPRRAR